jgi:glycosyltransferase involved in cell wall biosynthesis
LSDAFEFIIIDGGSTDGTIEIIEKYSKYLSYWISEKDNGIYDAWNKGILKSKGSFVAFLGMDDLLCENYSRLYFDRLSKNSNIDFVSSKMIINDSESTVFGFPFVWEEFKKVMNVVHPGALHSRRLFDLYGLYDLQYKIAGDYEFLMRCNGELKSDFIDEPTVVFSLEGVSNTKSIELSVEVRRAKLNNGVRNLLSANLEFLFRLGIALLGKVKNRFLFVCNRLFKIYYNF